MTTPHDMAAPEPPWLPELRLLVAEQPDAAAATLALALDPNATGRPLGRDVKPWLDRIRAEPPNGS
ncbi:MAG: hypothetical protein AAFX65_11640 [Cyanobacteria bacterium J06638_7]